MSLTVAVAYSQTDSVKVEYSQEKITKENKIYEEICDILTRREKDGKNLWKFDLAGTFFGGFNIAYERKLASKWSCNIQSITNFAKATYGNGSEIGDPVNRLFHKEQPFGFNQHLNFQLRYYYNSDRRIRLGKKSSFSGNYFGVALNNQYSLARVDPWKYVTYGDFFPYDNNSVNLVTHSNYFLNSFNFIYGLQRKIGKIGYIDASIGVGYAIEILILTYKDKVTKFSNNSSSMDFSVQPKLGIGIAF